MTLLNGYARWRKLISISPVYMEMERRVVFWNLTKTVIWPLGFLDVSRDGHAVLEKTKMLIWRIPRSHLLEYSVVSLVVRVSFVLRVSHAWYVRISSIFFCLVLLFWKYHQTQFEMRPKFNEQLHFLHGYIALPPPQMKLALWVRIVHMELRITSLVYAPRKLNLSSNTDFPRNSPTFTLPKSIII